MGKKSNNNTDRWWGKDVGLGSVLGLGLGLDILCKGLGRRCWRHEGTDALASPALCSGAALSPALVLPELPTLQQAGTPGWVFSPAPILLYKRQHLGWVSPPPGHT